MSAETDQTGAMLALAESTCAAVHALDRTLDALMARVDGELSELRDLMIEMDHRIGSVMRADTVVEYRRRPGQGDYSRRVL